MTNPKDKNDTARIVTENTSPLPIQIEGRHIKVTLPLQQHIHKKIDHLDKYFDGITNLHVILSLEASRKQGAEIICGVVRGKPLVGKSVNDDMYLSIDEAVYKVREHLKKYKARLRTRRRGTALCDLVEQEEPMDEIEDE